MRTVDDWKALLRARLREAMRARDASAVAVLRETLAAIDDAEARDAADAPIAPVAHAGGIAGGVRGLGAGDVARRELSAGDVARLIEREVEHRLHAAASFRAVGRVPEAEVQDQQAALLAALAREPSP